MGKKIKEKKLLCTDEPSATENCDSLPLALWFSASCTGEAQAGASNCEPGLYAI